MTMKQYLTALVGSIILIGCGSTPPPAKFSDLPLSEATLLSSEWQELQRFEAAYPVDEARAGNEGCATVEYVITPDYQITDINTIDSTSKHFAKQAQRVITRWNWSDVTPGKLTEPVKTRTRFEFCLEETAGHCAESRLEQERQCRGEDALFSVGFRVR